MVRLSKVLASNLDHEITHPDSQSFRYSKQCVEAYPLFAPFDFANVNGMKSGFLGQSLLTHLHSLALFSNGFAKQFSRLTCDCHKGSAKQEGRKANTPNMGVFSACTQHGLG